MIFSYDVFTGLKKIKDVSEILKKVEKIETENGRVFEENHRSIDDISAKKQDENWKVNSGLAAADDGKLFLKN